MRGTKVNYIKLWSIISVVFMVAFIALAFFSWTIIAEAAEATPPRLDNGVPVALADGQAGPPKDYSSEPNAKLLEGDYLQATTTYEVNGKTVMTIDLFYSKNWADGKYHAVYYNCRSFDGAISFSEREIEDEVIYVNDECLGLDKGQAVYAEIQSLLDEVGYN